MRVRKGFSIIEVLVVLGLLGTVGLIVVEIFIRSLRGSGKSVLTERLESEVGLVVGRIGEVAVQAKEADLNGVDCKNVASPGQIVVCLVDEANPGDCMMTAEGVDRQVVTVGCMDVGGGDSRVEEDQGAGPLRLTSDAVTVSSCELECQKSSYFEPGVMRIRVTLVSGEGLTRAEERASTSRSVSVVMENL
jgi:prepilin-type N-terminal cleavage/methylation domain-containing protein